MSLEQPVEMQLDHLRSTVAAYAVKLVEQDGQIKFLEQVVTALQTELQQKTETAQ